MKCLIDTNIIIWFAEDHPMLSEDIRRIIIDDDNEILVSIASLWEIAIKYSLGKLELKISLNEFFRIIEDVFCFNVLPVKTEHLALMARLPFHHRDPFDRLIYSQSAVENIRFIYTDYIFNLYQNTVNVS